MNKIALVTGSGRGLGKNTVLALAKQGVDVTSPPDDRSTNRIGGRVSSH